MTTIQIAFQHKQTNFSADVLVVNSKKPVQFLVSSITPISKINEPFVLTFNEQTKLLEFGRNPEFDMLEYSIAQAVISECKNQNMYFFEQ